MGMNKLLHMDTFGKPITTIDKAYGKTPEHALLSVLQKHSAFSPQNAGYIGERPAFMDLRPRDAINHAWDQYTKERGGPSKPGDEPRVLTQTVVDLVPEDEERRERLTINNVWAEVARGDGRAEVCFRFGLQLRESAWTGVDEPRPGDAVWACERISTEPL